MNARVSGPAKFDLLTLIPTSVEQRLKSYGFTQGSIIDAIREYKKQNDTIDANLFVAFAVNQFTSSSIVPHLWSPFEPTTRYLKRMSVTDELFERCLSSFRGKKLSFKPESLDSCFVQYCLNAHRNEQQANLSKSRTTIPDQWRPSDQVITKITTLLGIWSEREWDIAEYRLYWIEAGGKKDNWDVHFSSFMRKKYGLNESLSARNQ
ncbi:MAG: hypothetical protein EOO52_13485 [Gammaproteobacteria bacterium]|nr:MAG: hypothetical protein EOO52_13485 [Gammaproteobacteria bacterium]